jgi:uncharacterized heparinase superfamily protein
MAEDGTGPRSFRHARGGEDRGPSMVERIGERVERLRLASPIHRMKLKGRFPLKLLGVPQDPVVGDANRGQRLKAGRLFLAGHGVAIANGPLDDPDAAPRWRAWVHGWGWLRDAAADPPATEAEARQIETLARRWLARYPDYDAEAWAPELTGRRLRLAIAYAPLLIPRHDHVHRSAVLNAIARWTRHLDRVARRLPEGMVRAEALMGLVAGTLMVPGHDDRRASAEALLGDTLALLVGTDGEAPCRSPIELAALGDELLLMSRFYEARGLRPAPVVAEALDRVRGLLGLLAVGEALVPPWHGGAPTAAQLARLGIAPAPGSGSGAGFQRLVAGRTVLVLDAAPPPLARAAIAPSASTLGLVVADGGQLLIASCGGILGSGACGPEPLALDADLATGLRTTAAHSTLVLADTNSTRLRLDGPRRAGGVEEVHVDVHGSPEGQWVEARHDGYRRRFGFDHLRRLWLAADGRDLRGEDVLLPSAHGLRRLKSAVGVAVKLRFHLAPGLTVQLTGDGQGALIRLPVVRGREAVAWSFRIGLPPGGTLAIEPSLVLSAEGQPRATSQLVVGAEALDGQKLTLAWALRRQARD